ncbi:(d)CMP kinase, partial [Elusimicrobiota bacterium]
LGFEVVKDTVTNFLFVRSPVMPGNELFNALLGKGVIIRPMGAPGLENFVRISIGTKAENKRLLEVLKDLRKMTRKSGVIAMDGPVGVGKSEVSRLVARKLGFLFVNTGDMYRALTWKALKDNVNIKDKNSVMRFLNKRFQMSFKYNNGTLNVVLNGKELGSELRSGRVTRSTPIVACIPGVRKVMRSLQRQLAEKGNVVLEGRDITTHVAPDADLKVYLDAPLEERAKRRYKQLKSQGKPVKFANIRKAVNQRDLSEQKRGIMPKQKSAGTVIVNTGGLSLDQVVSKVASIYKKQAKN